MSTEYNWYPNRNTWLIAKHINPESQENLEFCKKNIQDVIDNTEPLYILNLKDVSDIDWDFLSKLLIYNEYHNCDY